LKADWKPKVIIHLDDEAETPVHVLVNLYRGVSLVLRMYNHGSSINSLRAAFQNSLTQVVVIPIGYLNGATESEDSIGKSGIESAREALQYRANILRKSVPYSWAFVGNRGMHHAHTTDARTAMTSFFSGLGGNSAVHLTEKDG